MDMTWPGGRKVAVTITVALELWSEGQWPVYAPMAGAWPMPGLSDTHSISWSEYGATTGVWRLLDILAARGAVATFGINSVVADRFPEAVLAVRDSGHEIAAHSYSQDVMPARLGEDDERANIRRCTDTFERLTGERPTGWMSPRATATPLTAQLLAEAGYVWSGDYNDQELPYVVATPSGPLVAIMHSDFTDVRGAMAGPHAYRDVHQSLLKYLLEAPGPGIFNLTIHAHVGGRPLLASMFDQILAHIQMAGADIWVATRRQIAAHVLRQSTSLEGVSHQL